jgi:electron transport complex protein RnfD
MTTATPRPAAGTVHAAAHDRPLVVTASPHLKGRDSTPRIMWNVVGSLVPLIVAATWFFGPSALLVVAASVLGAVLTEHYLGGRATRGPGASAGRRTSLADGSAAITGILLGLTLPAGMPLWMPFIGGAFAIGFGKIIFGGLGANVFNPALLGRAFLQAAFPVAITTWPVAGAGSPSWWALRGDNFALPFMAAQSDAVTAATPLGLMKFEHATSPIRDLMLGTTGGSLGETAGILILLCGAYLALRGYLNWRIPASILATVAAFAGILHAIAPARYGSAPFMLFSGGLMLGAVFMATDMVTAPVTNAGRWIFGLGIGLLVVIIRVWGGLPEGVMYAILLMNAFVPFINRATQPKPFGRVRIAKENNA